MLNQKQQTSITQWRKLRDRCLDVMRYDPAELSTSTILTSCQIILWSDELMNRGDIFLQIDLTETGKEKSEQWRNILYYLNDYCRQLQQKLLGFSF